MFYELAQSLTSGLLIGSALAVLSVGFSMAWGITHVLNVAHCAFAVLAAYLATGRSPGGGLTRSWRCR